MCRLVRRNLERSRSDKAEYYLPEESGKGEKVKALERIRAFTGRCPLPRL